MLFHTADSFHQNETVAVLKQKCWRFHTTPNSSFHLSVLLFSFQRVDCFSSRFSSGQAIVGELMSVSSVSLRVVLAKGVLLYLIPFMIHCFRPHIHLHPHLHHLCHLFF